jgi:hypothetical protein
MVQWRPQRLTAEQLEERRLAAAAYCVPSMNIDLEVKVLWEVGRNDPSEPQGETRERLAERSGVARPAG